MLPATYAPANGSCRQLFGRMMQAAGAFDERVVEAIRRIRGTTPHSSQLSPSLRPLTSPYPRVRSDRQMACHRTDKQLVEE